MTTVRQGVREEERARRETRERRELGAAGMVIRAWQLEALARSVGGNCGGHEDGFEKHRQQRRRRRWR